MPNNGTNVLLLHGVSQIKSCAPFSPSAFCLPFRVRADIAGLRLAPFVLALAPSVSMLACQQGSLVFFQLQFGFY
jgi:hypothetical protein